MNRKKSREYLMQLIYQMGITGDSALEVFEAFMEDEEISKENLDLEYIKKALIEISAKKEPIEEKITAQLVNWKLNRIAKVNLAILKVGVYEILYRDDIPAKVSINEALELCKKYSEEKSISFINGVLDKIYKAL